MNWWTIREREILTESKIFGSDWFGHYVLGMSARLGMFLDHVKGIN